MAISKSFTLSNGVKIPVLGYGTFEMTESGISTAIQCGYRHIDSAQNYGTLPYVASAIKKSGIPRSEFFVTNKVDNPNHGYENAAKSIDEDLKKTGLVYFDLMLIHWPSPKSYPKEYRDAYDGTWRALEDAYRAGKVRAIGVSNYLPHHLAELMETAEIAPMVNQMRFFPSFRDLDALDACKKLHMQVIACLPLGQGRVPQMHELDKIAEKYQKSNAQIALRWIIQSGVVPIPCSKTPERIRDNADIFNFSLSQEDMDYINFLPMKPEDAATIGAPDDVAFRQMIGALAYFGGGEIDFGKLK